MNERGLTGGPTTIIQLMVTVDEDGRHFVRSADVPGLFVWGEDEAEAMDRACDAVVALFQSNRNVRVRVARVVEPAAFPEVVTRRDQLVVAAA